MGTNDSSKKRVSGFQARDFLTMVMNKYKYGMMTEAEFGTALKEYLGGHSITVFNDEDLDTNIEKILPEMIARLEELGSSPRSTEEDQKKWIGFWILFKDCECLLLDRPLFSEAREKYLKTGSARGDEVEYSDRYLLVEREMETLVRAEVGEDGGLGFCHLYWSAKKKVLRDRFGIDWRSPSGRFPGMLFD